MKKRIAMILTMVMCLSMVTMPAIAEDNIQVMLDGVTIEFDQPPVIEDERTLVPIRAVCEKLGASVAWDNSTQTVTVTYNDTVLLLTIGSKEMKVNGNSIGLDVPPAVYNDRTLLPIRAVVENLGCDVTWIAEIQTVQINNVHAVKVPDLDDTQARSVSNWAHVSSVQQFAYKNEGLAYAYVSGGKLKIATPSSVFSVEMQYPKLGDVIADDDGNFYIIWGKPNETDTPVDTIFISKYSPSGQHIKTTGFVGKSSPWDDDDSAKTKSPFEAGNCQSVIAKGVLVSYYAKQRYDGHQSDNVIAVKIADMSPYQLQNDTYSGHSFNQSVIWSNGISDFLFASQGDAYARGFRVNDSSGKYGDTDENMFHFWIKENAGYDMSVVNKTYAQLGGLVEVGNNVAFVGASAKSLSVNAETEKQNLFIQIFDPKTKKYIGGENRAGMTADKLYGEHKPFTDGGVSWLTNYADADVIAPQAVAADDRIVVVWAAKDESFYTVLDANGNTLTPETSFGSLPLNSYERPVYNDGKVFWASAKDGRLAVRSIEIGKSDKNSIPQYADDLKSTEGYNEAEKGTFASPAPSPASSSASSSERHTPTPEELADPSYKYTHYGPEYRYEWTYYTGYHIGYNRGEVTGNSNGSYDDTASTGYTNADERAGYEAGYKKGYADGYKVGYESDYAQMKRAEKDGREDGKTKGYSDGKNGAPYDSSPGSDGGNGQEKDYATQYKVGYEDGYTQGWLERGREQILNLPDLPMIVQYRDRSSGEGKVVFEMQVNKIVVKRGTGVNNEPNPNKTAVTLSCEILTITPSTGSTRPPYIIVGVYRSYAYNQSGEDFKERIHTSDLGIHTWLGFAQKEAGDTFEATVVLNTGFPDIKNASHYFKNTVYVRLSEND